MKNKIHLPFYFGNMRELKIEKIQAIEGLKKASHSIKHKSTAFSSENYIPMSVWDLQEIIEKQ
jgi:hypothetical protein